MLKLRKRIGISGNRGRLISKALDSVVGEFNERSDARLLKIDVLVTTDPIKTSQKILSRIKLQRHGEIREWITENSPSFSYWVRGRRPVIMLNAKQKIFESNNQEAVKGLFAHELMHILNKLDGVEDELEKESEGAGSNIIFLLGKYKFPKPFTRERLLGSFVRVTTACLLYIKDILANTRAMSFGFDEHLYECYKFTLSGASDIKFTDARIVKALKANEKHVLDDVFLAYLGLNLSWVTFKMFKNMWYKDLERLAKIDVPKIIKTEGDGIIEEMLHLRSASDKRQIAKILRLTQQNYVSIVQYYCRKLR